MEFLKAKISSCWQCHDCLSCSGHSFFCVIGARGFDFVASYAILTVKFRRPTRSGVDRESAKLVFKFGNGWIDR